MEYISYKRKLRLMLLLVLSILIPVQASAAVTTNFRGRILDVTGTAGTDIILIVHTGQQVELLAMDANGVITRKKWPSARIVRVEVRAKGGNDLVFTSGKLAIYIDGDDDNDFLIGNSGKDTGFHGGDHDDIILELADAKSFLTGGDHSDLLLSNLGKQWHAGNDGPDLMYAGDDDDNLWGDDEGDDIKIGGKGIDTMDGEEGNDILYGMDGNDNMSGGDDNDILFGGNGEDTMWGNIGNDVLCGWSHHDILFGGTGKDWLYGEQGPDHHDGGPGNNELYGNAALGDTFAAGRINPDALCFDGIELSTLPPAETAIYQQQSYILVVGTNGKDSISIKNTGKGVQVDISGTKQESRLIPGTGMKSVAVMSGDGADDISIEGSFDRIALVGENGDDKLDMSLATARQSLLAGGAGNDVLTSGKATTVAWGGLDVDQFLTGPGRDFIIAESNEIISFKQDVDMIITADVVDTSSETSDKEKTIKKDITNHNDIIIIIMISLLFGLLIGFVVGRRRS
ncbi:MAG: hypothetical protein HOG49_35570 [Candidatus Scalindua sp.]|jgi:Ca2+-binding RTX toxin-like protein|nr:hypothetical protein [Candidatus Scalindua sp.]